MPAADSAETLLRVHDLRTYLPVRGPLLSRRRRWLKAVDGVSLVLERGRTLGIVGESGCGKTTLARSILRLIRPTGGTVWFEGRDVLALRGAELRRFRRRAQIIFQDPIGSLNPRLRVEAIVGEALRVHGLVRTRRERRERQRGSESQVYRSPSFTSGPGGLGQSPAGGGEYRSPAFREYDVAADPSRAASRRPTYPAICAQCGAETQLPFRPVEGKEYYCRDCYRSRKAGPGGP